MIDINELEGSPLPLPGEDVRSFLKRSTKEKHDLLDSKISIENLSLKEHYIHFLEFHLRALQYLEQSLEASEILSFFNDWESRRRRFALMDDLRILGRDAHYSVSGEGSQPSELRHLNEWEMLGVLYVLEGSRFGNAMILRSLTEATFEYPTAFLSHGAGESVFWKRVIERLEASHSQAKAIGEGSLFAFEHYLGEWRDWC